MTTKNGRIQEDQREPLRKTAEIAHEQNARCAKLSQPPVARVEAAPAPHTRTPGARYSGCSSLRRTRQLRKMRKQQREEYNHNILQPSSSASQQLDSFSAPRATHNATPAVTARATPAHSNAPKQHYLPHRGIAQKSAKPRKNGHC